MPTEKLQQTHRFEQAVCPQRQAALYFKYSDCIFKYPFKFRVSTDIPANNKRESSDLCNIKESKLVISFATGLIRKNKMPGKNCPVSRSQQKPSEVVSLNGASTSLNLFKYSPVFLLNFSHSGAYVLII